VELGSSSTEVLTLDDITVARRFQRLVGDHDHPIGRAAPWHPSGPLAGSRRRQTKSELSAHLLGTFVLICFGDGAMAVTPLNRSSCSTAIFVARLDTR
jgi:hypothetical protein